MVHKRCFKLKTFPAVLALMHLFRRVSVHVLQKLILAVELLVALLACEAFLADSNCLKLIIL